MLQALLGTVTGPDAEDLARAGLELVGPDPWFRSLGLAAAGLATLARGDYGSAVETLRMGYEAALLAEHPMAVLPAVNPLCHGLAVAGFRGEAEIICRTVLAQHADAAGRTRPIAWPARLVLGIVRYEANDLVEARRELEGGFEAARRCPTISGTSSTAGSTPTRPRRAPGAETRRAQEAAAHPPSSPWPRTALARLARSR